LDTNYRLAQGEQAHSVRLSTVMIKRDSCESGLFHSFITNFKSNLQILMIFDKKMGYSLKRT